MTSKKILTKKEMKILRAIQGRRRTVRGIKKTLGLEYISKELTALVNKGHLKRLGIGINTKYYRPAPKEEKSE